MDSDDYSTDEGKRKRDNEGNIFGKSTKIPRTPTKTSKNGEEKLAILIDMVKDLKAEIHQIRKQQEDSGKTIKHILDENENLRKENAEIKLENKQIREEITEVRGRIELLEKEKRRNNIVMTGMLMETSDKNKLKEVVENAIKRYLEVDIHVKNASKLGERTCLIELEASEDKEKVMKNKHRLNKIKSEKIYINEDLTKSDREKARQIRQFAKQEKGQGKAVQIDTTR